MRTAINKTSAVNWTGMGAKCSAFRRTINIAIYYRQPNTQSTYRVSSASFCSITSIYKIQFDINADNIKKTEMNAGQQTASADENGNNNKFPNKRICRHCLRNTDKQWI